MLIGTRDPDSLSAPASEISADPVIFAHATIALVSFESAGAESAAVMPPALHPTSPLVVSILAIVHDDVRLALIRVSCRHGARARALLVGSIGTAGPLGGLGVDPLPGIVQLHDDRLDLGQYGSITLHTDRLIGADDVQFVTGLHPVRLRRVGLRLAQVEFDVAPISAPMRSVPQLDKWNMPAKTTGALGLRHPVAAVTMVADLTIPPVRFVARADVPAHLGSERLAR